MPEEVLLPPGGRRFCCGLARKWAWGRTKEIPMAVGEYKNVLKYPSEDECLVRRLGSAVIASWAGLPEDVRNKLMAEARAAWDREFHVPHLNDRLDTLVRRRRS